MFTKGGFPYGWSGFASAGPFHGLSAFSNNVHAQNSDSLAQTDAAPELFGIDKEQYLGIILQNAASRKYRYDPKSEKKPSEFFALMPCRERVHESSRHPRQRDRHRSFARESVEEDGEKVRGRAYVRVRHPRSDSAERRSGKGADGDLEREQIRLSFAHGNSPGGYKVKGLIGVRPYGIANSCRISRFTISVPVKSTRRVSASPLAKIANSMKGQHRFSKATHSAIR